MVRDNLSQPDIWNEFFNQYRKNNSNQQPIIISHAKYPERTTDHLIKNSLIPTYIPTEWGHVTLTLVMVFLAQYALSKYNADRIIFLSDTCVPLQPPSHIHKFLAQSPLSWFYTKPMTPYQHKHRYNQLTNPKYISYNQLQKTSQWCILNKADAKVIVKAAPKELPNYKNQTASDEHYIITTLYKHYKNKYRFNEGMTTLVDWKRRSNNFKHPHTFYKLDATDIKLLTSTHSLFVRRVDPSSNIGTIIPELWRREVTLNNITKELPSFLSD